MLTAAFFPTTQRRNCSSLIRDFHATQQVEISYQALHSIARSQHFSLALLNVPIGTTQSKGLSCHETPTQWIQHTK